jgi:rhodanese-related sulfurtransferase
LDKPFRPIPRALLGLVACLWLQGVAAGGVETATVEAAHDAAHAGEMILVDIRTPAEWRESGIPDVAIPLDMRSGTFLKDLMALRRADPGRKLGLICAVGGRSRYLSHLLARKGIDGLVDVTAGVHGRNGWRARKLPLRAPDAPMVTSAEHPAPPPTTR